MKEFKIDAIPADFKNRGWKVLVDGQEVSASRVELASDRWGRLTYGMRPEGFDSWVYSMQNNAVTLPYYVKGFFSKKLYVGLLLENRANMGGENLCIIGGFTDPGETLSQAQKREGDEEASLKGHAFVIGEPMVTDRLFWDASRDGFGGNVAFAQRISSSEIVQTRSGEWKVRDGSSAFANFKKAQFVVFMEWSEAVLRTKDGIALAALSKLRVAFDRGEL